MAQILQCAFVTASLFQPDELPYVSRQMEQKEYIVQWVLKYWGLQNVFAQFFGFVN